MKVTSICDYMQKVSLIFGQGHLIYILPAITENEPLILSISAHPVLPSLWQMPSAPTVKEEPLMPLILAGVVIQVSTCE